MNDYLNKYNNTLNEKINILRDNALQNKVPIITDEGLRFICQLIKIKNAKNILEIGTAVGYSAINMGMINSQIRVTTIERDEKMYNEAVKNISMFNLEDRINVINADALLLDDSKLGMFDIIFIDAAKAQYIKFFEKYEMHLIKDGIIISDNLLFHGLVGSNNLNMSKDLRALIRKIDNYNEWLSSNIAFDTVFYAIGDGMAVSLRKE